MPPPLHAVTGAFGYSGRYIAKRLLARGHRVITLTSSPNRQSDLTGSVQAFAYHFDDPPKLVNTLRGVSTLYVTYWVRFNHPLFTFADAVRNTTTLFHAATEAGVNRVVYVSITNPSEDSPLEYFSSKARLERTLQESGLSHAILRPAVLFGKEDILINNIAWTLRHLPVFGVFGDGSYRLQPIYVDDLAEIAVQAGERRDNEIIQCIGPETFTYRNLVETLASILKTPRPILNVSPAIGYLAARLLGLFVRDIIITREEIQGLMSNLLYVDAPPAGTTRLTDWARENANSLGKRYASEVGRRIDRTKAYEKG